MDRLIQTTEPLRLTDPRLLLIDFTPIFGPAATSTLKAAYFYDWREDALLHVMDLGGEYLSAATGAGPAQPIFSDASHIRRLVETFDPQIILYRPVADSHRLHDFAMAAIDAGLSNGAALSLWLMDDWPSRLEKSEPNIFRTYDKDLRGLFSRSGVNFAISPGMAGAFGNRYGVEFKIAHNGISPEEWPDRARKKEKRALVRYAGSLAPDMTRQSVLRVAQTVSMLAGRGMPVRFEGRTQPHWMNECGGKLNALKGVSFKRSNLDASAYRQWLCDADILLIAYNFDEATRTYLNYSFANKTPETMAAGAAILAYGPEELETVSYLRQSGAALMVMQNDEETLKTALISLIQDEHKRAELGAAARTHAFRAFDISSLKTDFKKALANAVKTPESANRTNSEAGKTIATNAAPPPSAYRRFAMAVHEKAPLLFKALRPIARTLRGAHARLSGSPSSTKSR